MPANQAAIKHFIEIDMQMFKHFFYVRLLIPVLQFFLSRLQGILYWYIIPDAMSAGAQADSYFETQEADSRQDFRESLLDAYIVLVRSI